MFGIKKKVYNIFALIFSIIGIVLLILTICNVFGEYGSDMYRIFTLTSIISLLLAFAISLRPKTKLIKITMKKENQYRNDLYTVIIKDSSKNKLDVKKVIFKENENNQLYVESVKTKEQLVFDDMNLKDSIYIIFKLMEEFSEVMYAVIPESKNGRYKKPTDATIDSFEVEFQFLDGTCETKKYIENKKYLKI